MYRLSIVTPTYNVMRTLDQYMSAILSQDYPLDTIEIVIADGGSTDGTLEKFDEYKQKVPFKISIFENQLKTAEAGKAVGVRHATGDIVLLLDSDNIMPDGNWLSRMMNPFEDEMIIASEPIEYTYRREDGVVNRYCALIGMNDPLCLFTGNYDRYNRITGKWTEVDREEEDRGDYFSIKFRADMIPTIGANGFLMRAKELKENFAGEYLFDIDVLWELFLKNPELRVAKVKTGIVHLFCPDTKTFIRKQNRRINDYLFFSENKGRKYPWNKVGKVRILLFVLCCITLLPLIVQSIIGFTKRPDILAWAYHIPACWITLVVYGVGTFKAAIIGTRVADRSEWKQ